MTLKNWIKEELKSNGLNIQKVRLLYNEALKETGSNCSEESFYSTIRKYKSELLQEGFVEVEQEETENPLKSFEGLDRDLLIEILEEEIAERRIRLSMKEISEIAKEREIPAEAFSHFIPDLKAVLKNIYNVNLLNIDHEIKEVNYKEQISLLKKENNYLKREEARFALFLESLQPVIKVFEREDAPTIRVSSSTEDRIVQVLLSDAHIGEVVSELDGLNDYDFDIAKQRMEKYFNKVLEYSEMVKAKEVQINILGDMISGNIHEELIATNEFDVVEAVLKGADFIAQLIYELSKQITVKKVIAMPGNHSRFDKKMPIKGHNQLSHEKYLFHFMEKELKEVISEFIIPKSIYHLDECLGTRVVYCHGDFFRGSTSNLSTVSTTWARDFTKLNDLFRRKEREANILCMGHVHSDNILNTFDGGKVITNSSIIGPNEFSVGVLKVGSPPSQTVFTLDKDYPKQPRFLETIHLD